MTQHPSNETRRVLTEEEGYSYLGFSFSSRKKWAILTAVFVVQLSMNFNAAVFSNAIEGIEHEFDVHGTALHLGQSLFLIAYAFGCELWAPWSEELGRKWILQASLGLVNIFQIPIILAGGPITIPIFRVLGGLSSAGGSVTLGIVADLYEPERQQYAVAYVVLSSVSGAVLGPIFGGFIQVYASWRWVFVAQLIFGAVAQVIHFCVVPETRSNNLLDRRAQEMRKAGEDTHVYGPNEIRGPWHKRITWAESKTLMWRPYKFLLTEPIVTWLSLLSGFSDALTFTGLDSYGPILKKWHFSTIAIGLAFIPLLVGNVIGYASFMPVYRRDIKDLRRDPENFKPERRLWLLLFLVILMPIGLFGFAWTSLGPPHVPWIAPLIFTCLIGIANLAIYLATIDYMIAAYGPYSASATGGNGFCRDFLAGCAAFYAKPLYSDIATGTKWQLAIPTFILTGIAVALCIPVFFFYFKGAWFRKRSPFAQELATERVKQRSRQTTPTNSGAASRANSVVISPLSGEEEGDKATHGEVVELEILDSRTTASEEPRSFA